MNCIHFFPLNCWYRMSFRWNIRKHSCSMIIFPKLQETIFYVNFLWSKVKEAHSLRCALFAVWTCTEDYRVFHWINAMKKKRSLCFVHLILHVAGVVIVLVFFQLHKERSQLEFIWYLVFSIVIWHKPRLVITEHFPVHLLDALQLVVCTRTFENPWFLLQSVCFMWQSSA